MLKSSIAGSRTRNSMYGVSTPHGALVPGLSAELVWEMPDSAYKSPNNAAGGGGLLSPSNGARSLVSPSNAAAAQRNLITPSNAAAGRSRDLLPSPSEAAGNGGLLTPSNAASRGGGGGGGFDLVAPSLTTPKHAAVEASANQPLPSHTPQHLVSPNNMNDHNMDPGAMFVHELTTPSHRAMMRGHMENIPEEDHHPTSRRSRYARVWR